MPVPDPTPDDPWICRPQVGSGTPVAKPTGADIASQITGLPGRIDPRRIMADALKRRTALAVAAELIRAHCDSLMAVMGLSLGDVALLLHELSASMCPAAQPDSPVGPD